MRDLETFDRRITINRGMIDGHTSLAHYLFEATVADTTTAIPAISPQNHLTLKMMPLEIAHQKSSAIQTSVNSARAIGQDPDWLIDRAGGLEQLGLLPKGRKQAMAGLLARGRLITFPVIMLLPWKKEAPPVASIPVPSRSQSRGQPRIRPLMGIPHRVPC